MRRDERRRRPRGLAAINPLIPMHPPIAYLTSALLLSPGTLEHFARDLRYLWTLTQTHPAAEIPALAEQHWAQCYPEDSYGSDHSLRLIAAYDYVLKHQHELLV